LGLQLGLDTHVDLLRWWPRRKVSLGIFEVFSIIWLGHAPTWRRVPRVNVKAKMVLYFLVEIATACPDGLNAFLT